MPSLFPPAERLPRLSPLWCQARDGDPDALALFRRHYSCTKLGGHLRGNSARFAGPGETLILLAPDARALVVWRKERYRLDSQQGVCCSVFRNESDHLASVLLRDAMDLARDRWGPVRLFTFVDPRRIRPTRQPGRCFLKAGWHPCGRSKDHGYIILEHLT